MSGAYFTFKKNPEYDNLREMERKIMQQIAEDLDKRIMGQWYPSDPDIMVLDAETAAMIEADDIECEIINDKPTEL